MTLVAILAWHWRELPSDMRKQCLHIASTAEVERLLGPSLLRKAHARLARKSLRERTLHHHALISRLMGKVLRGVACRVQMRAS